MNKDVTVGEIKSLLDYAESKRAMLEKQDIAKRPKPIGSMKCKKSGTGKWVTAKRRVAELPTKIFVTSPKSKEIATKAAEMIKAGSTMEQAAVTLGVGHKSGLRHHMRAHGLWPIPREGLRLGAHPTTKFVSDEALDEAEAKMRKGMFLRDAARECGVSSTTLRKKLNELYERRNPADYRCVAA